MSRVETPCARFLNSDRKYNKAQGRPTYQAFKATYDDEEGAVVLSMYRLDSLETREIWDLGEGVLGPNGGRLHGRAELNVGEIEAIPEKAHPTKRFRTRFDDKPVRHVTVAPWEDDKGEQKLRALELAAAARLYLV